MIAATAKLRRLWRDQSGAYSTMVALMLPVLMGFAALGTETGLWMYAHQNMQGAVDGAAYSAATAYAQGNTATFQADARAIAARYGYINGNGTSVAVNRPPAS